MANILAILPGLSIEAMDRMAPAELMRWHAKALARAPNQGK